jgi:hypothetical protein
MLKLNIYFQIVPLLLKNYALKIRHMCEHFQANKSGEIIIQTAEARLNHPSKSQQNTPFRLPIQPWKWLVTTTLCRHQSPSSIMAIQVCNLIYSLFSCGDGERAILKKICAPCHSYVFLQIFIYMLYMFRLNDCVFQKRSAFYHDTGKYIPHAPTSQLSAKSKFAGGIAPR